MAVRQHALLTAEDYRSLPESGPRYQLIEGELHMAPAPNRYHQEISRNIEFILLKHLEQHPSGKIFNAPFDVCFTEHNVFQPDLIYVANDRLSILTDQGATGPPSLLVEILSHTSEPLDRSTKKAVYARTGVEELWLVDPLRKQIELYRLQQNPNQPLHTFGEQDTFTSTCLPGLEVHCPDVFKS